MRRARLPGFETDEEVASTDAGFPDDSDLSGLMDILYKKEYPDTVDKIGKNYPRNGDLAGQKYPIEKLPEELRVKYPESVWFKETGCPDFTPYIYRDETGKVYRVEIDGLTGNHRKDFKKANEAIGILELPEGYTWHHKEDARTMEAVPEDLHYYVKHTGGAAKLRGDR